MGILDKLKNVAKAALRIGNIVVPVLRGLGEMVPELGNLFAKVDEVVEDGGVEADNFLDRNLAELGEGKEFFLDLQTFAAQGAFTCDLLIRASQVDTPDLITVAEAEEILKATDRLRELGVAVVENNEGLEDRLLAME